MQSLRIPATFLFLMVFLGACQESLPTDPGEAPVATPQSNFLNGPTNPGNSGIVRFNGVAFTFSTAPALDLIAAHFQGDDMSLFGCSGGSDPLEADVQWVNNQEDIVREITKLVDAPIVIARLSESPFPFTPGFCEFWQEDWIYQGTHTLKSHDNDLFNGGPGANSFGWSGQGTVYDPAGTRYRYTEQQLAVLSPDDQTFRFLTEIIRVHRTGN